MLRLCNGSKKPKHRSGDFRPTEQLVASAGQELAAGSADQMRCERERARAARLQLGVGSATEALNRQDGLDFTEKLKQEEAIRHSSSL